MTRNENHSRKSDSELIYIGTIVEVSDGADTFLLRVTDPTYDYRGPWAGVAGIVLSGEFEGEEMSASYDKVRVVK